MRKIAHYYYLCGNEIQIMADVHGHCSIFDKDGLLPLCPIMGVRHRHPNDGQESVEEYATLGLYYKYEMIGWER
jgi:hypothetical protein